MQIPFSAISISCACLLVLFGFIINNEVDARALTRDETPAASHHNQHQHSAHGKKPKNSQFHVDINAQKHARAVKAVLDYAQYKLQQSKRDDDTPTWTEEGTDTAGEPDQGRNYNNPDFWNDIGSDTGNGARDGTGNDDNNVWTESETGTADGNDQETDNNDTPQWNEVSSRQLKQRQAKRRLSRNK